MALFEGKTTAERNKTIAALVFGAVALFLLARLFFGSPNTTTGTNQPRNSNRRQAGSTAGARVNTPGQQGAAENEIAVPPQPVVYQRTPVDSSDAGRNIFAYYVGRPAGPRPSPTEAPPAPATPTPTPPIFLGSIAPQSRYARTQDFPLQVTGDKFTPESRVYVDGQEVPTLFGGPQQLTATVPASLITSPGVRQIMVRTPDNQLYSNSAALNVTPPPVPNYTYVGYISRRPPAGETGLLKDQKNELLSVQRGDTVGGRFRVAAISNRGIDLVDKDLDIKHTLPLVESGRAGTGQGRGVQPPPPPNTSEDETDEEP